MNKYQQTIETPGFIDMRLDKQLKASEELSKLAKEVRVRTQEETLTPPFPELKNEGPFLVETTKDYAQKISQFPPEQRMEALRNLGTFTLNAYDPVQLREARDAPKGPETATA